MDARINQLLERLAEVSDDQLADLEDVIRAGLEEAAEAKDVDNARAYAESIEKVRTERSDRLAQAQARETEIASIMQRVNTASAEDEAENGDDDDADGNGDASASDGDGSDAGAGEGNDDGAADGSTASTISSKPLPSIADLTRTKRPATASHVQVGNKRTPAPGLITAAVDVPGLAAGSEIPDATTLRNAIFERWQALSASRGLSGNFPVAKFRNSYPDERMLHAGDNEGNWDKIQSIVSPSSLVASGGICAPVAGYYDANTLAGAARPLRDSLPRFGADRGGIRFIRATSISDYSGAIGHITEAEDAAGGGGGTKPCLTIVCEDVQEVLVNAVSRCLTIGNFNARTHPEFISHITDNTLAAHARVAEENLWETMCSASTAVTSGENLSAWRDVYATLARAAAQYRSRHRMTDRMLRWVAPAWLVNMFNADLVRQAPGDNTIGGVAREAFEAALGRIGVSVTWTLEGGTAPDQVAIAQAAGGLNPWLSTVETLLYAEGVFLYLDHGTLDLGVVRDSTLNVVNDFQTFAEVFENVAFLGPEALCLTLDVCPSGLTAGALDDYDPCAIGS